MKSIFKSQVGQGVNRSKFGTFMIFLFLIALSAFMMFPFIYSVMQSLKPYEEIFAFPPRFFVENPSFENYLNLFRLADSLFVPFSRYVFNSVSVAVIGTAVYVLIASMASYSLAFGSFKGRSLLSDLIVKALLFTSPVTAVAQYLIIAKLHMLNTYFALLLPILAMPFGVFLMRQFLVQMIPISLIEAARIDGCSEFHLLWAVVMPVVKPAIMTLILFTFQNLWNNTGASFIYDESHKVLPTVMNELIAGGISRAGEGAAATILLMLPPVIIFFLTQRQVLETMAASGIKE